MGVQLIGSTPFYLDINGSKNVLVMSDKARGQSMQKDRSYDSPRSSGSHGAQIKSKRYSVESEGKKRRSEPCEDDYDSEAEFLNFDKLKKFHIPRKKSHEERGEIIAFIGSAPVRVF